MKSNVIELNDFPTFQRQAIRIINREAANLIGIEAIARSISDISTGNMSPEKLNQIQMYAEAIMYQVEDARERMQKMAIYMNDTEIKQ